MGETPPDLKVRTLEFARRIIRLYSSLPRDTVAQVLGKQLLRSGTSSGANYREATTALEREIDQRVYRLYALTSAEIQLVEEAAQ